MKKYCSISVDMDPVYHYLYSRNYDPIKKTNLNAIYEDALPRFLDIFDEYNIKATFFIVGKDAENIRNKRMIYELAHRGHEVANHSYSHFTHFRNLSIKEKTDEIQKADILLSDITGEKIHGFRAPGWGIDTNTLSILENSGYTYDSSVFPSLFVSIIKYINWFLNKGRIKINPGNMNGIGSASKLPYHPSKYAPWKKGQMKIVELPVTVLPVFEFPFLGTILFMLGKKVFKLSYSYIKNFKRSLLYELHGIELVDYYTQINDERLKIKRGIDKTIDEKTSLYHYMLNQFRKHYNFLTMKKLGDLYK